MSTASSSRAASFAVPDVRPRDADIRAAADLLNAAERPALLVGRGAAGAGNLVLQLAETLGAGVVTTSLLGKPYIDERHPLAAGTMGHLGTTASAAVLAECDALLIVGSNDPWTEYYPAPGQARAIQIDIDPRRIGDRYPIEVGVASNAAAALDALLPRAVAVAHRAVAHPGRGASSSGGTACRPSGPGWRQTLSIRRLSSRRSSIAFPRPR